MSKEINVKERFDVNLAEAQGLVAKFNQNNEEIQKKQVELKELENTSLQLRVDIAVKEGILNELKPFLPEEKSEIVDAPLANAAVN